MYLRLPAIGALPGLVARRLLTETRRATHAAIGVLVRAGGRFPVLTDWGRSFACRSTQHVCDKLSLITDDTRQQSDIQSACQCKYEGRPSLALHGRHGVATLRADRQSRAGRAALRIAGSAGVGDSPAIRPYNDPASQNRVGVSTSTFPHAMFIFLKLRASFLGWCFTSPSRFATPHFEPRILPRHTPTPL